MKKRIPRLLCSLLAICMLLAALMLLACGTKPASTAEHTHEWKDGVCTICGEVCAHNRYQDGYCKRCGMLHQDHRFWDYTSSDNKIMNDVCEVCGFKCLHTELDENHICKVCGKEIKHRFSDATHTCIAPGCTATTKYNYDAIPDGYADACDQPGEIVEIQYETPMYIAAAVDPSYEGKTWEKTLYVYLPYGYDPEKSYDILYLIHGRGGEPRTWLILNGAARNMIDNMIKNDDCEPFIIVTPSYYYMDKAIDMEALQDGNAFSQYFYQELQNVVIPLVESRYKTYAQKDVSTESLIASREHRAIAGFSRGSSTTEVTGMMHSLPLFSYFGNFSGLPAGAEEVNAAILSAENEPYEIKFMYVGNGRCDYTREESLRNYLTLIDGCPKLRLNENLSEFVDKPGFIHDAKNSTLDLYNFIKVDLFRH